MLTTTTIACDTCGQLGFWGYFRTNYDVNIIKTAHRNNNKGHKVRILRT